MKRTLVMAATLGAVLLVCAAAWASAEAGPEAAHHYRWGDLALRVGNFVLFAFILWKVVGKRLATGLSNRREGIGRELDELAQRKADAIRHLEEVQRSIANLETERQEILARFREQGEALKAAIVAKAQAQAEQIRAQALMSAENEARQAREELRDKAADEIIQAAERLIRDRLTESDHQQLIDKSITKVVLN